ncbi:patatin-like phospholipase family protein [Alteromonas sp. ASW11-130]|uniref:patatin-like phospholipase family protein n=1 Tax=Alteromonas sp. ASW11-130 TaxID=3015775 RepID=UPI0022420E66|nr:patatin-like phospholipase family protein [Alteromonas sp. ASW11-130]MCW8093158.1 patatin-like phospholipase family protein [Alteromonas sp. ASW11-130]
MPKLILSLDGGGIRGAATTQFLTLLENELQQKESKSIRDFVDFYAGTSTGCIIALALATTQLSMDEINDLYNPATAKKIFKENKGLFELDGLNAPKFEAGGKTSTLKQKFGSAKLNDVPEDKHVLAVSYDITRRRPVILKSTQAEHTLLKSYAVADASSAAPTYFPTIEMKIKDTDRWLVDGGITANNPTMCAIAEAKRVWKSESISDLRVLSIGTGYRTRKINGPESQHWGKIGWITKGDIINLLADELVVGYQAFTILDAGNYIRVNSEMRVQQGLPHPPDDAMDDISTSNIKKLKDMGKWWFDIYGDSAIELLLNTYNGNSLERIDPQNGKPITG